MSCPFRISVSPVRRTRSKKLHRRGKPKMIMVLHFAGVLLTTRSMRQYLHSIQVAQVFQLLHDSTSVRAITGFDASPASFKTMKEIPVNRCEERCRRASTQQQDWYLLTRSTTRALQSDLQQAAHTCFWPDYQTPGEWDQVPSPESNWVLLRCYASDATK